MRPTAADLRDPLDDAAALAEALAPGHRVEAFGAARAYDLIWMQARRRFDLCVYELADTPAHQFIWPYLLRYPGVLLLRDESLQSSRADALWRRRRMDDYVAEFVFDHGVPPPWSFGDAGGVVKGGWPMLRAPLLASRLTVVRDRGFAADLHERYPDIELRQVPIGVREPPAAAPRSGGPVRVGILDSRSEAARDRLRALAGRQAACEARAAEHGEAARVIAESDVVVAFEWPARREPPVAALAAMAAARPTIVLETHATAGWPALDPQTWQPRDRLAREAPAMVSIDVRDEEHSLALALRRLAADEELRARLGAAAHAWWQAHATVAQAAGAWRAVFADAAALDVPPRPSGWPPHLIADGSEHAQEIADRLGVELHIPGFTPRVS